MYYFAPNHLKYDIDSCAVYSLQTEVKITQENKVGVFPLFYTHCTEKVSDWPKNRETLSWCQKFTPGVLSVRLLTDNFQSWV